MEIHLATLIKEWQRSEETVQKDVHKCLQPRAWIPEGPADPCKWIAVWQIKSPSTQSKVAGWHVK